MKLIAAALFFATLAASAQTPAKRPMTFADLQAMKRVSDPQISPSGKWVLFSVTEVSLEKNTKENRLWIVPLDGASGSAAGAQERPLRGAAGKDNGRFSPDGKWVMFTHMDQIWIAPFDDAQGTVGDDHAVTALETGADGAIWAPDSRHILFTSSVYPECESKLPWEGAGAFRPLNSANSNGGFSPGVLKRNEEEANCNALKDTLAAKDPVKAQIFDGLLYRHWNAFVGPKHSHIFYADAMTPTPAAPTDLTPASVVGDHEAPTFSLGGPLGYAISPDGKEIAYVTNLDKVPAESTNNDIFTLQVGAEPSTAKKISTSPGSDDGPQYSPDGKYLAWRSQARNGYESDKFDLAVMDRATGKISDVMPQFDEWIDSFQWSHDSKFFYVTAPYSGQERVFTGPWHDGSKRAGAGDEHFSPGFNFSGVRGSGEVGDLQAAPDGAWLVATRMYVDQPSEIVVRPASTCDGADSACGEQRKQAPASIQLTHLNSELAAHLQLSPLNPFWFSGAGGVRVQGFIVKPPNFDPSRKYPVKFLIHGGPQGAWGDAWSYRWNPELFAASGYVVVMINPRGSTGYGQKFLEEVSGDWGGRAYTDLMRGLDYAEQHYPFIDKSRECALGASYGGYMANWVLTHTDRFKCIVTHDGMYNPQSAFGTTEELWFNEWEFRPLAKPTTPKNLSSRPESSQLHREGGVERPAVRDAGAATDAQGGPFIAQPHRAMSGPPQNPDAVVEQTKPAHPWDFYNLPASEDPFRKWSPMLAIKNAHTPTLVVHSQRDYRLDVSEGFQLFTALQLLGVPSRMLYFPDEGHWVLKPKNSEIWYSTVNDWCDRWLGMNKYAAIGPEPNPMAQKLATKPQGTQRGGNGYK